MLIPEHKIQEVLDRVDILAVVSRHVELKKAGRSYKGKCPFHQEKSPSFYVTPDIRRFKCFGCQAGGDAIAFVQRYLGKTFVDAVKDLAREAGVDLEAAVDPTARRRQQLKEAVDLAAEHFKARLWDAEKGAKARGYLDSRAVSEATAKAFGLGWAPPVLTDLTERFLQAGMLEWAADAGLVKRREKTDGYYDFFRSRLIIPIRSPEGRTIAFGGRYLQIEPPKGDFTPPKYLNSPESLLYNKSEVLFGMDLARDEVRRAKSAVLVEGYFDCIALHDAGVRNAVALCSTALTAGHLKLLERHDAKDLVLLLDGDEAGRKAVERLAGPILAAGFASRVATLPEGEDPDTFARKAGAAGVRALLEKAPPLTEHLFRVILPNGPASSFEEKMRAIRERLRPICEQLPVGLTRSGFLAALGQRMGLPVPELEASLKAREPPARPKAAPNGAASRSPAEQPAVRPSPPPPTERAPDPLESAFGAAILRVPRLLDADEFRVRDELAHGGLRSTVHHVSTGRSAEDALYEASPLVKAALERASRELPSAEEALEPYFLEVCRKLKLRRIDEALKYIASVIGRLHGANDLDEDTRRLIEQRVELLDLKKKLT